MTINVATVKLLEDKLFDLTLWSKPDVDWFLALLREQYNLGFKEGYTAGEHETEVEYDQSLWELGYNQGILDGRLDSPL